MRFNTKSFFGVLFIISQALFAAGQAPTTPAKPTVAPKAAASDSEESASVFAYDVNSPDWPPIKLLIDDSIDHPEKRQQNLADIKAKYKETVTTRWVDSKVDDLVVVYSFFRGDSKAFVNLKTDEKEREALVTQQFKDLLKVAQNLGGGTQTEAAGPLPIQVSRTEYKLKLPRAEVKFTGKVKEGEQKTVTATANPRWVVILDFTAGGGESNAPSATVTTLTGPREPWSISADAAVGQLKQLKLDDKAESFGLKDKPGSFYVSFNFIPVGDALLTPRTWTEAVQFLAMLKASNRPTDSYGLGIGLRGGVFAAKKVPSIFQIFDTVTPFAAVTRTRLTGNDAAGKRQTGHRTDLIIGLSLDIKKGVEWTTKKAAAAGQ